MMNPDQIIEECDNIIDDNPDREDLGTVILLKGLAEFVKENVPYTRVIAR